MKTKKKFNHKWVNRYTITLTIFLFWILLLDGKYSLVKQYKLVRQINEMEQRKKEYTLMLEEVQSEYDVLIKNKEKYAREKYFLSKPGEDVFIIE